MTCLNTLQSNFAIVDAIRKSGRKLNEQAIPEMVEWCRKIGYEPESFNSFKAIHIAGTKGKGSTAAFTSSILCQFIGYDHTTGNGENQHVSPISKVGLYTSPHLKSVRERIQINGEPLSETRFTQYFFEVWDTLEEKSKAAGEDPHASGAKPIYFRFLTLMAFHTFKRENVDVAVIECGIGGAYDSTNVLEAPAITAITSLGIDHVGVLGSSITDIAWHKSGIMKRGVTCLSASGQPDEALAVMQEAANSKGASLEIVKPHPAIVNGLVELGLEGDFQVLNASLAVQIAKLWLRAQGWKIDDPICDARFKVGLLNVRWPGRCQTIRDNGVDWYIDGAHTIESIKLASEWFAAEVNKQKSNVVQSPTRCLIFNQQTRDAVGFATELFNTLSTTMSDTQPFKFVIFCTNTTFRETGYKPDLVSINTNASDVKNLTVQKQLAETWTRLDPCAKVEVVHTIEEAVTLVRSFTPRHETEKFQTFVTGSLHLVGGFLEVLDGTRSPKIASASRFPAGPSPQSNG